MKKIISFSLYANLELYNLGAIENVPLIPKYYGNSWKGRFYVEKGAPALPELKELAKELDYVEVVEMSPEGGAKGMFWRFLAFGDPDAERIIIRDTDQRLSDKEAKAVAAWEQTDKKCHKMVENGGQAGLALMGCAFGLLGGLFPNIQNDIDEWLGRHHDMSLSHGKRRGGGQILYGADQLFLKEVVWPVIEDSVLHHGYGGEAFPEHEPPPWDVNGDNMFRRIKPGTNNLEILGDRPSAAYDLEGGRDFVR